MIKQRKRTIQGFLYKGKQHNIIPKGLRIKPLVESIRAERIARTCNAIIRERINYHRLAKIRLTEQCKEIRQAIKNMTNERECADPLVAVLRGYGRTNDQ